MLKQQDVLDVLSHTIWKTPIQISCEISERKHKGSIWFPSYGEVYIHLGNLEANGYVEKKERQLTPEQLAMRGGRIGYEYRLTSGGLRIRYESEQKEHGFGNVMVPSEV